MSPVPSFVLLCVLFFFWIINMFENGIFRNGIYEGIFAELLGY